MKSSEQMNEIATALAKAQAEMSNPVKDRTAWVYSERTKSEYTYNYADLACVLDAVRPALSKHGIALIQTPEVGEPQIHEHGEKIWRTARLVITTRLMHGSGQWIESQLDLEINPDDRVQSMGSSISYLRRYALQSIVGISAEEDDDGASANRRQQDQGQRDEQREERRQPPAERRQAPAPRQDTPKQQQAPAPAPKQPVKAAAAPASRPSPAAVEKPSPAMLDAMILAELPALKRAVTDRIATKIWGLYDEKTRKAERLAAMRSVITAVAHIQKSMGRAADQMIAGLTIDREDPDNVQGIVDDLAKAAQLPLPPLASGEDRPPF